MSFLLVSFFTALVLTFVVIRSSNWHARSTADQNHTGPQKYHRHPVPRVGGVGVFAAVVAGALLAAVMLPRHSLALWLLIASGMPTFAFGLTEDITNDVSPRRRLAFTVVSAGLAAWLLDAVVRRTDIPGIQSLVQMEPFAIALTLLVVTGLVNAVNIIDGFNGLASMCVLMMVLAFAYVGFRVGDPFIITVSLITAGAVLGFFVWNFPAGLIFLGDGGAYFLGFLLAELGVLLLSRNVQVSPMFPLLLCAYPIVETIFSMYRRKVLQGVATSAPDAIHLHTLIHRRLVRRSIGDTQQRQLTARNSMTSPYLWLLCLLSVIPAVLWWDNTAVLAGFLALFVVSYVILYWRIVRFRVPKWLMWGQR